MGDGNGEVSDFPAVLSIFHINVFPPYKEISGAPLSGRWVGEGLRVKSIIALLEGMRNRERVYTVYVGNGDLDNLDIRVQRWLGGVHWDHPTASRVEEILVDAVTCTAQMPLWQTRPLNTVT